MSPKNSTSILALLLGILAGSATHAHAQAGDAPAAPANAALGATAPDEAVENVVVTGTSLRGVAPAGTNLITMTASDIANSGAPTVQSFLSQSPLVNMFGSSGEGDIHNQYFQPNIHQVGAGGSNATLVLIDGHRPPTGGTTHTRSDPNIIPTNMLERIQVIANGDSSIYGSDAVAGVINFITRDQYDGLQLNAQLGVADGLTNFTAGVLSGASWTGGNMIFAYQYVDQGGLLASERSFSANPDQTARAIAAGLPVGAGGGSATNFKTFTGAGAHCAQPLVRVGGSGNYYNMVTGQSYSTNAADAPCNLADETTLISPETRNNVMMKLKQKLGDTLTASADLLYAHRQDALYSGAGTVSNVTVFSSGAQANPFFKLPPGYTGAGTKETVYGNLDGLLGGPRNYGSDSADDMYGTINLEYRLGDNFVINGLVVAGRDDSVALGLPGTANAGAVDLALNGTANNGGKTTTPAIAGTTIIPLNLPLTTANALDIWNPAGSGNRTSADVISSLKANQNLAENISSFAQYRLSTNGTAFDLPAGPAKIALGMEAVKYALREEGVSSNNTGSASTGSNFTLFNFDRVVQSAFAETQVPVIGPEMNVPLVQKFDINVSGRYDHYSDFGATTNYKLAFDWAIMDGLKLRGNMSTSFVAPQLDQLGDQYHAFSGTNYGSDNKLDGVAIPVAAYPVLTQFAPSQFNDGQACTLAKVTCVLASTVQGVSIKHGLNPAQPSRGRGWEVGVDWAPQFLPGFFASITYWNTQYLGAITAPSGPVIINNAPLQHLATFYPGAGASPSVVTSQAVGLSQKSALPPVISYIYTPNLGNYLDLYVRGIDANISYNFSTDIGDFHVSDALTQLAKYDMSYGGGGVRFSIKNTDGSLNAFPQIGTNSRANFGWAAGPFSADLFVNYTGGYRNWSGTSVIPITHNAQGNPDGGGDPVKANVTLDLGLGYQFQTAAFGDDQINLSVKNLTDSAPPFYLADVGYDSWAANPMGRLIQLSFTAKY